MIELFEWIESRNGRLDVLVDNAGIAIVGNVEELDPAASKLARRPRYVDLCTI